MKTNDTPQQNHRPGCEADHNPDLSMCAKPAPGVVAECWTCGAIPAVWREHPTPHYADGEMIALNLRPGNHEAAHRALGHDVRPVKAVR